MKLRLKNLAVFVSLLINFPIFAENLSEKQENSLFQCDKGNVSFEEFFENIVLVNADIAFLEGMTSAREAEELYEWLEDIYPHVYFKGTTMVIAKSNIQDIRSTFSEEAIACTVVKKESSIGYLYFSKNAVQDSIGELTEGNGDIFLCKNKEKEEKKDKYKTSLEIIPTSKDSITMKGIIKKDKEKGKGGYLYGQQEVGVSKNGLHRREIRIGMGFNI